MKILLSLSGFLWLCIPISQAQNVSIPDSNFKTTLVNYTPVIDTNTDGEIQVAEAAALSDEDIALGLEIYPNPVTNYITIKNTNFKLAVIYDFLGRRIKTYDLAD